MQNRLRIHEKIYMFFVFAFMYAPILVLMVFSFNESKTRGNWTGFSLRWYQELFQNRHILEALRNTLVIAIIATVIATIVGTGIIIPIVVTGIISILGIIIAMFVWLHELIKGKNR